MICNTNFPLSQSIKKTETDRERERETNTNTHTHTYSFESHLHPSSGATTFHKTLTDLKKQNRTKFTRNRLSRP